MPRKPPGRPEDELPGPSRPATGTTSVDAVAAYRGIFESLDGFFALLEAVPGPGGETEDLHYVDINENVARFFGRPRDAIVGHGLFEVAPDDAHQVFARLRAVARTGRPETFEFRMGTTGQTFRVQVSRPRPGIVAVVAQDVTAGAEARRALEERERELRESQRVAGVGSWVTHLTTGSSTWSEETFRIHGLDPGGAPPLLSEASRFYEPESLERLLACYAGAIEDGTPYEVEVVLTPLGGGRRSMVARGEAVRDEEGRIVKLRGTVLDVTDRVRAQAEIDDLRLQVAHVARVSTLGELVSSLAHELSQPLAAVVANAEAASRMLQGGRGTESLGEVLADIVSEAGRAAAVIDRLRALLRRDAPAREVLDLGSVVREVAPLAAAEARHREASIRLELADDLPAVSGDRVQLQQVLLNLILNGLDAVTGEPAPRVVLVRTLRDGGTVLVEVTDSGPGIPEALLGRVFEPFYTTKPSGLGIGLPSSRTIVQAHGGAIRAEQRAGRGATFVVALPAVEPASRSGTTR